MLDKRFFWSSMIALFLLLSLTLIHTQAAVEAGLADTPTPSETPRPQAVRRTVLANSIRGLALNAPNDANLPPCQSADFGVSIWQNGTQYSDGSFVEISPLSATNGVMLRATDGYLPAICSSDPIGDATAFNDTTGENYPALVWSYNPANVSSSNSFYDGSVPEFYVAQLPLAAYREPANWRLHIDSPSYTDVEISVDTPSQPSGVLDSSGNYVLLGLHPGEHVVGLIFNDVGDANGNVSAQILDDFEFTANSTGIGYVSSQPYWNAVTTFDDLVTGLMVMVGNRGSGLYYPLGENGTFIFTNDNSIHPADTNGDSQVSSDELIRYVQQNYWASAASFPTAVPGGSSSFDCGSLSPHMVIGRAGYVLPGELNNLRDGAGLAAHKIGTIPANGQFLVLAGPVCADGYAWWQVNYNGVVGWTAEGGRGVYWIDPE